MRCSRNCAPRERMWLKRRRRWRVSAGSAGSPIPRATGSSCGSPPDHVFTQTAAFTLVHLRTDLPVLRWSASLACLVLCVAVMAGGHIVIFLGSLPSMCTSRPVVSSAHSRSGGQRLGLAAGVPCRDDAGATQHWHLPWEQAGT